MLTTNHLSPTHRGPSARRQPKDQLSHTCKSCTAMVAQYRCRTSPSLSDQARGARSLALLSYLAPVTWIGCRSTFAYRSGANKLPTNKLAAAVLRSQSQEPLHTHPKAKAYEQACALTPLRKMLPPRAKEDYDRLPTTQNGQQSFHAPNGVQ
jgi:hypothetical protein